MSVNLPTQIRNTLPHSFFLWKVIQMCASVNLTFLILGIACEWFKWHVLKSPVLRVSFISENCFYEIDNKHRRICTSVRMFQGLQFPASLVRTVLPPGSSTSKVNKFLVNKRTDFSPKKVSFLPQTTTF